MVQLLGTAKSLAVFQTIKVCGGGESTRKRYCVIDSFIFLFAFFLILFCVCVLLRYWVIGICSGLDVTCCVCAWHSIQASLDRAKEQLSKNLLSTIQYLDHRSAREKYRIVCKDGM